MVTLYLRLSKSTIGFEVLVLIIINNSNNNDNVIVATTSPVVIELSQYDSTV